MMEKIVEFIGSNYAWFLTITILKNKNDLLKKSEEELDEESLENIMVAEDKKLSDMVVNTKDINPETKEVNILEKENEEPKEELKEEIES